MKKNQPKSKVVEEVPYGMYVWQTPDGEVLGDGDGNIMNVFCMKGDLRAIKALSDAARYYGFPEGTPVWWSGKRPITDDELAEQEMRARLGLVPDPLDYAAVVEEMKAKHQHGR
jgi:hypothetical protein